MNNIFLQESIKIGDQLIATAKSSTDGIYWETASKDTETDSIVWEKSEGIYSGVSGIALFLIELFKQTKEKKYLDTANKAMQWVDWYCKKNPTNNYALFTGRLGVSFVYLRFFEITNDRSYLEKALFIAKNSFVFLDSQYAVNDLINGFSGTLLGLLHLYAVTNEQLLLEYLYKYIQRLLKNARYGKEGLYWDISKNEIHPLCGFSHGSSGIGFVFLELGHYFRNPAYYYVAEQAFAYENSYFDHKTSNWPDFRINMYTQEQINKLEKRYQKGDITELIKFSDMNSWCHGAAGIGLSRLRALHLLKNEIYRQDIQKAYTKTVGTNLSSFTLCHGNGGIAEFFIENYLSLHNIDALKTAQKIAHQAMKGKKINEKYLSGLYYDSHAYAEDPSLFNGIAGIGYFFLRVANPKDVSSILALKVNVIERQNGGNTDISLPALKQLFIAYIFPQTIERIREASPRLLDVYLQKNADNSNEVKDFIMFVKKILKTLPRKEKYMLKNVFAYELTKRKLQEKDISSGLLYIKQQVNEKNAKKLLTLTKKTLVNEKLHLASEIRFLTLTKKDKQFFLLKRTAFGIEELEISQFCYVVLYAFNTGETIADVLESIYALYKPETQERKKIIEKKVIDQINEAVRYGILHKIQIGIFKTSELIGRDDASGPERKML
jgi:hypothetical protein